VASGLSLIAGVADLMPPPSLLCVFAAQLIGEKNHFRILKESLPLIVLSLAVGIAMIIYAAEVGSLFRY
jgi:hypothetical protein